MLRALVVDDEPLSRRTVRRFLQNDPSVEVVGECGDGESAVEAIRAHRPDLVFLDVQMPEMNGLDVVRTVGVDAMPATIFVTAFDQYAVDAFDANAIDYLLKPVRRERFDRALTRARDRIAGRLNVGDLKVALETLERAAPKEAYVDRLPVASGGRVLLIAVGDIDWIAASGNYARIHARGRTYDVRETLTHLEGELNPRDFARIHRSTIVNIRRIREIHPWFRGHHVVVLDSGDQLRMSRYQTEAVRRLGLL